MLYRYEPDQHAGQATGTSTSHRSPFLPSTPLTKKQLSNVYSGYLATYSYPPGSKSSMYPAQLYAKANLPFKSQHETPPSRPENHHRSSPEHRFHLKPHYQPSTNTRQASHIVKRPPQSSKVTVSRQHQSRHILLQTSLPDACLLASQLQRFLVSRKLVAAVLGACSTIAGSSFSTGFFLASLCMVLARVSGASLARERREGDGVLLGWVMGADGLSRTSMWEEVDEVEA